MSPAQRFVLFLSITPLVFAGDEKCPPLWHPWRDSCYRFTESKSWADAKEACRQMGGDMAAPRSQEENDVIWGFGKQLSFDVVWIDCRQEGGHWFCGGRATGETFNNNWSSGEPNGSGDENCAAMHMYQEGLWMDEPCKHKLYPAICKTVQCASPAPPRMDCFTTNAEGRLENNLFDE